MPKYDLVYFTDEERQILADTAETARAFLHTNPTRSEYDTWHANFLAITPSLDPDDDLILDPESRVDPDLI